MIGRKMGELREGAVYSGGKKHDSYTIIYSANYYWVIIDINAIDYDYRSI